MPRIPAFETARCHEIASLLESVRDILDERVTRPVTPAWAGSRGWDRFLLGIADRELEECERGGPAAALPGLSGVPASLAALATRVRAATAVTPVDALPLPPVRGRHVSPRKHVQIHRLIELLGGLRRQVDRIVDVGSGAGHLTRLANAALRVPVLGLERQDRLVERARRLESERMEPLAGLPAESEGESRGGARFVRFDAFSGPLDLAPGDLALGLHACGALADVLVAAAAKAPCAVALVACCHQKHPGLRREPLSELGRRHGMSYPSKVLGLANLHPRPARLGSALGDSIDARTGRYALCLLLEARGLHVDDEMTLRPPRGHRTYRGFSAMTAAEFRSRGLEAPPDSELLRCLDGARRDRAAIRRLSLPRNMLARLLELGLAVDRVEFLRERGFLPRLAEAFPEDASPRNILLLGEP